MSSYSSLAHHYDSLTLDVPYGAFADYYEKQFDIQGVKVRSILDLACGTGTLTCLLAERGYDMIGTDASPEMLSEAAGKAYELSNRPLFLNQTMEGLDLYGTVDAVVCSLDGINYVEPSMLNEVFHRVRLFLEPNGIFIFDIHKPEKLKNLHGEVNIDETDDVFCVWRTEFVHDKNACIYGMDIFTRVGRKWERSREEHVEYVYDPSELETLLSKAGLTDVRLFGDLSIEKPTETDGRFFITARKPL